MAAFSTLYGEVCEQLHDSSAAMVTRAKEWINFAQQEVATAAFWPWLLEIDAIATDADVTTGTAAVANGDATVTITATPTTMPNGQWFFQVAGDTYWYPVASRTDATDFELVVAYQGDTDPVAEYTLRHLTYSLPSDVWAIADIRDQNQPNMLRYASHKTVDLLDIANDQSGTDTFLYIPVGADSSGYPQVMFYPPRVAAGVFLIRYYKILADLSNDADIPKIPAPYHKLLVYRALIDGFRFLDDGQRQSEAAQEYGFRLREMKMHNMAPPDAGTVLGRSLYEYPRSILSQLTLPVT